MLKPGPFVLQYGIVLTVNIAVICLGMGLTWTSPVLIKLFDEENPALNRPITQQEASWIASITFIGGIFGILTLTPISDVLGRKKALVIYSIPRIFSYALLTFATEVWMVILARLVLGLSNGVSAAAIAMYSSEIASKEIRGGLGTMMQIFTSVGAMMMFSIGPFVSYFTLNLIILCIAVVAAAPLPFLPDSPYFLFSQGKTDEALEALTFFRGSLSDAMEEMKEYKIRDEESKVGLIREIIKNKVFLKSVGLAVSLNVATQLTGISAVNSYLQTMLVSTESNLSSEISSVIIGLIQLTASIGTTMVNDTIGRKPILISSTAGMSAGFVFLGLYFNLTSSSESIVGFLNYLPLISLVLIVFCYNFGVGSIGFPLQAELLDNRVRAFGLSMAQLFGLVIVIINIFFFQSLQDAIGEAATYWIFSVTSALLVVFICFLPETKGKSFREIQNGMKKVKPGP